MSSVYTGNLTVAIFGQSHAPAIGVTVDGLPAGLPVDLSHADSLLVSGQSRAKAESNARFDGAKSRARM